ncbi:MAG TPA: glycosyltransferase [Sphingomicrobium sp.]|nr:glycosyltransferase [Sphingomicrobium sp.]
MDQSHTGFGARTRSHELDRRARAAVAAWAVFTCLYLYVRIPLWNPGSPTLSTLLLAAELFGIFSLALHIFSTWTLVDRRAPPPAAGASADIFVTTWNEPVEMLRNTLLAAKAVRHAGTVWLLDDGARPEMRRLAAELGVAYLARTDRAHAKAGNLNNALGHSNGKFVAIFDCDHAPSPDFLERTLGYFSDPRVAFVQTPQDFYNVDSFQHRGRRASQEVWHEQTLFYRVIQPGKDRWNAAFFCGSCAVVRREALDAIGGFATGTITEDLHTSLKLHKAGWSSAYHSEALAFGLSPSDFDQYQTQRLRWARGAMQVWRKEGFLFRGGLTLAQKLSYLASTSTYFEGWQKGIVYFLPVVVILTGWMPITNAGPAFLTLFALWLLSGMALNEAVSRGYAKTVWMEEYNFFRYFTFIRASFALVLPLDWRFMVTPKGRANGRSWGMKLLPQLVLVLAAAAAFALGTYIYLTQRHLTPTAFAVTLLFLMFDLILGVRALSFAARHSRQRRGSHRFPLPLPVTLEGRGWSAQTVAEDVSSDGMSLHCGQRIPGKTLKGVLHLPNGDLQFAAAVRRRFSDGRVGLEFRWAAPADSDALNACLYGNTLQWDINSWTETRRRGARFPGLRSGRGAGTPPGPWRIGTVRSGGHRPIPCVARCEKPSGAVWRVVSYRRPQSNDRLELVLGEEIVTGLSLATCESLTTGGGTLHVSMIAADASPGRQTSHRQPQWSSRAFDPPAAFPAAREEARHAL